MATWAIARDAVINGIGGTLSGKGGTSVGDIGSLFNELFIFHKDPIVRIFVAALLFAVIAFVMGVATDNYSWVDKSWSILPVYYAWVIAMNAPASIHPRLLQMAMFVSFWGIRLTYNFSRKVQHSIHIHPQTLYSFHFTHCKHPHICCFTSSLLICGKFYDIPMFFCQRENQCMPGWYCLLYCLYK